MKFQQSKLSAGTDCMSRVERLGKLECRVAWLCYLKIPVAPQGSTSDLQITLRLGELRRSRRTLRGYDPDQP